MANVIRSSDLEQDFWFTEPGMVLGRLSDSIWCMTHSGLEHPQLESVRRMMRDHFPWYQGPYCHCCNPYPDMP